MRHEIPTRGIITHINHKRRFGFVRHGCGEETFFHFDSVVDLGGPEFLRKDTLVEFFIKRNITHEGKSRAFCLKKVLNF